jgi:hypothetical protein
LPTFYAALVAALREAKLHTNAATDRATVNNTHTNPVASAVTVAQRSPEQTAVLVAVVAPVFSARHGTFECAVVAASFEALGSTPRATEPKTFRSADNSAVICANVCAHDSAEHNPDCDSHAFADSQAHSAAHSEAHRIAHRCPHPNARYSHETACAEPNSGSHRHAFHSAHRLHPDAMGGSLAGIVERPGRERRRIYHQQCLAAVHIRGARRFRHP